MISFLIRYYFDELSTWVVLTPLFFSFLMFFIFLEMDLLQTHLLFTLTSFSIVCTAFFDFQKRYKKMFVLFPMPFNTFLTANSLFLSGIILSYCSYSVFCSAVLRSLIEKQLVFPSLTNWLILLCVNFIFLALCMVLYLTKFQFIMGLLPFLILLSISSSTPYLRQFVDSIPLLFCVAVLSFVLSILITNYFSTRRDIV